MATHLQIKCFDIKIKLERKNNDKKNMNISIVEKNLEMKKHYKIIQINLERTYKTLLIIFKQY